MRRLKAEPFGIRQADEADLDAMVAIETRAFRHPWSRTLFERELCHDWSTVLVATEAEGRGPSPIRGFAVFWTVVDEVHVLDVAVDPDHRRRGVASALVQAMVDVAESQGSRSISLEVRRSNTAAQALYRHHGFRPSGVRPRYYVEEGEDAIIMERRL
jgi:[ribosomal protein S18]-alanine N-acetyltransferase